MATETTCLKCGAPLTGDARGGFCPRCLFAQASAGDSDELSDASQIDPSSTAAAKASGPSDHVSTSRATEPPMPRAAYLDEASAAYAPMRRRFLEVLRSGEEAGGFLRDPAPAAQRPAGALTSPDILQNAAAPGEKVGNDSPSRPIRYFGDYELLEE